MRLAAASLLLVASLVCGCVSIGSGADAPAHAYLQLSDAGKVQRLAAPLVDALLIQPQPAGALADTVSIAYSRAPDVFGYYQFASWVERPVRALPRLLQQRLQERGVAGAVGQLGDTMRADWLLSLRVVSLYHDVRSAPGQARLLLQAELFDRRQRQRVAIGSFSADVPAARADATAAAAAMSQAVSQSFDALGPWLEAALVQAAARPAPPAR
ncbi:MAG: ABC-type transport auxiliary lipoprotein family protein [Rubrivivax sp.]|nr:ABC-type transport auxiliary lipoprotein family protein [Rubrivivax sp.]